MTPKPPSPEAVQTAERNLDLIRSLKSNHGYQQWLLPRLESLTAKLTERLLNGLCLSYEDYTATVTTRNAILEEIITPIAQDERRHEATLGAAQPDLKPDTTIPS